MRNVQKKVTFKHFDFELNIERNCNYKFIILITIIINYLVIFREYIFDYNGEKYFIIILFD